MQDFQDRGESYRQELGIDGTAGDAQDVPHPYKPDGENKWCLACGLSKKASVHNEPTSEQKPDHEFQSYLADGSQFFRGDGVLECAKCFQPKSSHKFSKKPELQPTHPVGGEVREVIVSKLKSYPGITANMDLGIDSALVADLASVFTAQLQAAVREARIDELEHLEFYGHGSDKRTLAALHTHKLVRLKELQLTQSTPRSKKEK